MKEVGGGANKKLGQANGPLTGVVQEMEFFRTDFEFAFFSVDELRTLTQYSQRIAISGGLMDFGLVANPDSSLATNTFFYSKSRG